MPFYSLSLHSGLFPSSLPTRILYAFLMPHASATCPTNPIRVLITLIIFSEAYRFQTGSGAH
jgi:hypothetical protein